jgi:hypothetical protein
MEVGLVDGGAVPVVITWVVGGAAFGGGMYLLVYRRFGEQATANPADPPTQQRETTIRTVLRSARPALLLVLMCAIAAAIVGAPAALAGIASGNGLALLALSQRLRSWEKRKHRPLLREPRWRWRGTGSRRYGHGVLDPKDIYSGR